MINACDIVAPPALSNMVMDAALKLIRPCSCGKLPQIFRLRDVQTLQHSYRIACCNPMHRDAPKTQEIMVDVDDELTSLKKVISDWLNLVKPYDATNSNSSAGD